MGLTWIHQADSAPLVVGPSSPQLPICLFQGPPDWHWQACTYLLTIVAERDQDPDAMRAPFAIPLSAEDAALLNERSKRWGEVRTQIDAAPAAAQKPSPSPKNSEST